MGVCVPSDSDTSRQRWVSTKDLMLVVITTGRDAFSIWPRSEAGKLQNHFGSTNHMHAVKTR